MGLKPTKCSHRILPSLPVWQVFEVGIRWWLGQVTASWHGKQYNLTRCDEYIRFRLKLHNGSKWDNKVGLKWDNAMGFR